MNISTKQAAETLNVTHDTIHTYISRKRLTSEKPGTVTLSSVEEYLANPKRKHRPHSKKGTAAKWKAKIYNAVLEHYREGKGTPVYEDIAKRINLVKSGISRYLPEMAKEGLLDLHNFRIYLPGLRAKIAKIAKEAYEPIPSPQMGKGSNQPLRRR